MVRRTAVVNQIRGLLPNRPPAGKQEHRHVSTHAVTIAMKRGFVHG
jgi:hypothetical protein